jgi:ribosomal-protein-alanine N-acetyltransferase
MSSRRKQSPLERGERVYLRRPTFADAKEVIATVRTSRDLHRPWLYPTDTERAFDGYIRRNRESDFVGLLICRLSDHRIIGMANLSQIFRGNLQGAYLGFWASAEFAGRGYMTEGLQLVLHYAFKRLRLHRLEANVQPENQKSKALIKRSGFRYEGFSPRYLKVGGKWRDHERWAIVAEEVKGGSGKAGLELLNELDAGKRLGSGQARTRRVERGKRIASSR